MYLQKVVGFANDVGGAGQMHFDEGGGETGEGNWPRLELFLVLSRE